jgi:hypothetical protein
MIRLLVLALAVSAPLWAHEGHEHEPAQPRVEVGVAPRAVAESEAYELVAVLQPHGLTLYLDRYDSNEPVADARIEVESGALRAVAKALTPGVYALPGETFTRPGSHPLTVTAQAGGDTDLLATTLVVGEPVRGQAEPAPRVPASVWWSGGGVLLAALGYAAMRSRRAARR